MFLGTYYRTLDAKGRLVLPSPHREQLEGGAFITRGPDRCLVVFTKEEFDGLSAGMSEKARRGPAARKAVRAFFNGAAEATPDRQGRVSIPEHLRRYAGLGEQVVIGGVAQRMEIWDAARYETADEEGMGYLDDDSSDLNDIGI